MISEETEKSLVFGLTFLTSFICIENQFVALNTFKRYKTKIFLIVILQNFGTLLHNLMFLWIWNYGYVSNVVYNFVDGIGYILQVNLSAFIAYNRMKLLLYKPQAYDFVIKPLIIFEALVLAIDTMLFQFMFAGIMNSSITKISGPVTAFYYIFVEIIIDTRLMYNLLVSM